MDFKELIQIALDALLANKLRTFLTALGIIIGTASVITMIAIGNGAKSSVESRISSLGANTLTISPGSSSSGIVSAGAGSAQTLVIDDYTKLKSSLDSNQITGISPEQSKNQQVIYKSANTNTSVIGVAEDYLVVRNYSLKDGSFFSQLQDQNNARVAVIGSSTATTLFANENPLDKQIQIGSQLFTVIGLLNTKGQTGFQNQDDLILIPLNTSKNIMVGTNALRSIVIDAKSSDLLTNLQNQVTTILAEQHKVDPASPDFTVNNSQQTLDTLSSVTNTFTYLLAGIASISLLVGGIGIMNTMIISITERTREIGLRKAIGAKERSIMTQFVVEALVLSVLGAGFGIILGVVIATLFNSLNLVTTQISLDSIIISAGISLVVGLIFGIYPARKASKLSPIEALRYE